MNTYPPNWRDIARAVKEAAGWQCIRCTHPHDPGAGYTLTVHHLDGDKANCAWYNLVALCQRCHLRIQAKVIMSRVWMFQHSAWFVPYVAGYYAALHNLNTERVWVEENADYLIALGQGAAPQPSPDTPCPHTWTNHYDGVVCARCGTIDNTLQHLRVQGGTHGNK